MKLTEIQKTTKILRVGYIIEKIAKILQVPYLICAIIMAIVFQGHDLLLDKLYEIGFYAGLIIVILYSISIILCKMFMQRMAKYKKMDFPKMFEENE